MQQQQNGFRPFFAGIIILPSLGGRTFLAKSPIMFPAGLQLATAIHFPLPSVALAALSSWLPFQTTCVKWPIRTTYFYNVGIILHTITCRLFSQSFNYSSKYWLVFYYETCRLSYNFSKLVFFFMVICGDFAKYIRFLWKHILGQKTNNVLNFLTFANDLSCFMNIFSGNKHKQ